MTLAIIGCHWSWCCAGVDVLDDDSVVRRRTNGSADVFSDHILITVSIAGRVLGAGTSRNKKSTRWWR